MEGALSDGDDGSSVEAGGNSVEDDGVGGESVEAGGNTVGDARRSNVGVVNGNRKKRGRKPGPSKGAKKIPRKTKGTN